MLQIAFYCSLFLFPCSPWWDKRVAEKKFQFLLRDAVIAFITSSKCADQKSNKAFNGMSFLWIGQQSYWPACVQLFVDEFAHCFIQLCSGTQSSFPKKKYWHTTASFLVGITCKFKKGLDWKQGLKMLTQVPSHAVFVQEGNRWAVVGLQWLLKRLKMQQAPLKSVAAMAVVT